ncbi:hypothetical protein CSB37_02380 [bacterium DOLZORAL124_38_8]|nr:MAG: hypothetical protein CSB37_02380 [bacterium DOLZORAL124_38_8]
MRKKSILITGAPGSGKTTIANALFRSEKIVHNSEDFRLIGTDTIREIIKSAVDPLLIPELQGSSIDFCDENDMTDLSGFLKQAEILAPGIEGAINRNKEEGRTLVLEGIHCLPNYLSSLADVEYFVVTVPKSQQVSRLQSQHRSPEKIKRKMQNMERYLHYQEYLIRLAEKYDNVHVIQEQNVSAAVDFILSKIL